MTTRALLEDHTPVAVTIDRDFRIVYYHGDTSPFIGHPAGEPTRDLLSLARDSVRGAVRAAIQRATAQHTAITVKDGAIEPADGPRQLVSVTASPISPRADAEYFVVSFRLLGPDSPRLPDPGSEGDRESPESLRRVRDELQSTIEELQTSNEELKAAHEEVVSTNEELQSTNEELETSREEMQSLNEELATVNSQLQAKMDEYQAVTNDMSSLLTSTDIAVLFLDTRFCIRRFTPQVRELFEMLATDIGRPMTDLARKFEDPHLSADARTVLEKLVPCDREVSVAGERWYSRRITPYRTTDNRIDGVVIAFVDITERHRATAGMRAREEQFRNAIEQAPIPILIQSETGKVMQVSRAWTEITGQQLGDLTTSEAWIARIVEPEAAGAVRIYINHIGADESCVLDLEFGMRGLGGDTRHWKLRGACPGRLLQGERFLMFAALDITERKAAERALAESKAALEAASAHKDAFIANMSHELRTPLSNILTWSKILLQSDLDDDQRKEAANVIARNSESQRRLIEDLLDTTRIASGKLRLNVGPFEPAEAVRNVLRAVAPVATARGLDLSSQIDDSLGTVLGDVGRFEQIVSNLLTNAVKFTPANGWVKLSLVSKGPGLELTVSDSGRGIPREYLGTIFNAFHQAPSNDGLGRSGLGLGLSIVRALVEMQNGTVTAHSEGLGKGSTFTVWLPLLNRPLVSQQQPGDGSTGALHNLRVLLAEDNADARLAFTYILEQAGASVQPVRTGAAALDSFKRHPPSVIVSDLNMPEMDGVSLLQAVRVHEVQQGWDRTPAVAISAHTAGNDRQLAAHAGFDLFIAKPFEPPALIAEIVTLIRGAESGAGRARS